MLRFYSKHKITFIPISILYIKIIKYKALFVWFEIISFIAHTTEWHERSMSLVLFQLISIFMPKKTVG